MLQTTATGYRDVAALLERGYGSGWAESFCKAAVAANDWSSAWGTGSGAELADAFLATLRDTSVLDAVAPFAVRLPPRGVHAQLASGASADVVTEGVPVAVSHIALNPQSVVAKKAAALVVLSDELSRTDTAQRVISAELRAEVSKAVNSAFLGMLTPTSATAGTDALATIDAALAALGDCTHVVMAAPSAFVREVANASQGRVGLTGGTLFPGVQIIATAAAGSDLFAIPADRVALREEPLIMSPASDAAVQMVDNPLTGEQSLVSLWQNGLRAVLVLREFAAVGNCVKIAGVTP